MTAAHHPAWRCLLQGFSANEINESFLFSFVVL